MREIFPAFRCLTYKKVFGPFHFDQKTRYQTYRTVFESKVSYKLNIEPFGQDEMARKLSYKYEIKK